MAVVEVHPVPIDGRRIEGSSWIDTCSPGALRPTIPGVHVPFKDPGQFRKPGERPSRYTRLRGCVAPIASELDDCDNRAREVPGEHARWNRRPSISWWTT